MARYRKIDPRIWNDEVFEQLSPTDKLVAFYLLTSPQTNRLGIYKLRVNAVAEDIGIDLEATRKACRRVAEAFGWPYDEVCRTLLISTWWKYNHPESPNHLKSCLGDLHELPRTDLINVWLRTCDDFLKWPVSLPDSLAQALPKAMPNKEQEQEQEKEQEYIKGLSVASRKNEKPRKPNPEPVQLPYTSPEYRDAWEGYLEMRRLKKYCMTARAIRLLTTELAKMDEPTGIQALDAAVVGGWKKVYLPSKSQELAEKEASERRKKKRIADQLRDRQEIEARKQANRQQFSE